MKKVICYGTGGEFLRCLGEIMEKYEVVAVTAIENPEIENLCYIEPQHLNEMEYDYILITSQDYVKEIYDFLIYELGVANDKILYYENVCTCRTGKYYAQIKEDAVVEFILNVLNKDLSDIHYIEFGACYPILYSNTYYFYRKGAKGVLVEPNRKLKGLLELVRPNDILLTKAVGAKRGTLTFYESVNTGVSACTKPDEGFEDPEFDIVDEYTVEVITLNDVLEELGTSPDILSVDVEGMEYEILVNYDFKSYRPLLIIAEVAAVGRESQNCPNKLDELMIKNDYKRLYSTGLNYIYKDIRR